jgi:transcriptional regulator
MILKALSWGPMHGYGVARWIEQVTADVFAIEEGSLYPALHRMQRRGWLTASWGSSENNRRAKYYTLTAAGRRALGEQSSSWLRLADAVSRVFTAPAGPATLTGQG